MKMNFRYELLRDPRLVWILCLFVVFGPASVSASNSNTLLSYSKSKTFSLSDNDSLKSENVPVTMKEHCNDTLNCFVTNIFENINEIRRNEIFHLTENLVLRRNTINDIDERVVSINDGNHTYSKHGSYSHILNDLIHCTKLSFFTHSLIWKIEPNISVTVYQAPNHIDALDLAIEMQPSSREQRTFGARRRIMMALLPMMYKMGVMSTMLGILVVLALKGITIGIILLFLSLGNFLSKFKGHHGITWQPQKPIDIHVHVHTDSHKQAYSGWNYGSTPFDYTEHHES